MLQFLWEFLEIDFLNTYETGSNFTNSSGAIFFKGHMYGGSIDYFNGGDDEEINLKKIF